MESRSKLDNFLMVFLLLVAVASASDLLADLSQGASPAHLLQEASLFFVALLILVWLIWDYRDKKKQLRHLQQVMEEVSTFPRAASPQLLTARQQLSEAISSQFENWHLSLSEKEIGRMLLKGYSLKEISILRGTAEKTIRQQASAIYQKSGVSGRHAFSAWFLEDLL